MGEHPRMHIIKWTLLLVISFFVFMVLYSMVPGSLFMNINLLKKLLIILIGSGLLTLCYRGFESMYRKMNPMPVATHLFNKSVGIWTLKGMAVGVGYFVVLACVMMICGCYRIADVQLPWVELGVWLAGYLAVAVGEEIMFRGIIFRLIDERWNFWPAILVSGLLFGFAHQMEQNATVWSSIAIAIEAGLLLGAAYKWSGSLWFPIGIHWAWNYTQGCILGCGVSGKQIGPSIITPELSGSDIITGGAFGPEASVPAVIVGFAISCYLIYRISQASSR